MYGALSFQKNSDGSYDLIIRYERMGDTEFAVDFLSRHQQDSNRTVAQFVRRYGRGLKLHRARIVMGGVGLAELPVHTLLSASAASRRYSMAYLDGDSPAEQIQWARQAREALDTVSPGYFTLEADGTLRFQKPDVGAVEKLQGMGLRVVPTVSNHWNREAVVRAMEDPGSLAREIASYVEAYNLDGIQVDLDTLTPDEGEAYVDFAAALRESIPAHKEVAAAVNPQGWAMGGQDIADYSALARHADYLLLRTWNAQGGSAEPGPAAGIGFVEEAVAHALSQADADRIVVELPFCGRIWGGDGALKGCGVPLAVAEEILEEYRAQVVYDQEKECPVATFQVQDRDRKLAVAGTVLQAGNYVMWFENDRSILAKLNLVDAYHLKGAGIRALGQPSESVWQAYRGWLEGVPSQPEPPPAAEKGEDEASAVPASPAAQAPSRPIGSTPFPEDPMQQGNTPAATLKRTGAVRGEREVILRSGAGGGFGRVALLPPGTPFVALDRSGDWYRVQLADGTAGFLPMEDAVLHRAGVVLGEEAKLRDQPSGQGEVLAAPQEGTAVAVLSVRTDGWVRVRTADGVSGYLPNRQVGCQPFQQEIKIRGAISPLQLREAPSVTSQSYGTVPAGERVLYLGTENGYAKISYGALTAYVNEAYLQ